MKLLETETKNEKFEPFELKLLIESEGEAHLLWHVFNKVNLDSAIFNGYDLNHGYSRIKCDNNLCDCYVRGFIESKIKGVL